MKTEAEGLSISDSTEAFAVPGQNNLIDCINPLTGLSWVNGHNLQEMQARHPNAQVVNIDEWCKAKGALQDSAIEWSEVTEENYWDILEVLPPACMIAGGFLAGEPWDHHAVNGQPRFAAYIIKRGGKYLTASRPMTIREFKSLYADKSAAIAKELGP